MSPLFGIIIPTFWKGCLELGSHVFSILFKSWHFRCLTQQRGRDRTTLRCDSLSAIFHLLFFFFRLSFRWYVGQRKQCVLRHVRERWVCLFNNNLICLLRNADTQHPSTTNTCSSTRHFLVPTFYTTHFTAKNAMANNKECASRRRVCVTF